MSLAATHGTGRHAVVIGGGIAGLSTARVLTEHFDRVTVLERDKPQGGAEHRAGVPQARHVHVLLAGGEQALEGLFPGLREELTAAGAPWGDYAGTSLVNFPIFRLPTSTSGVEVSFASRPFREYTMRCRLERDGQVEFRNGIQVKGLVGEGHGVSGVKYRDSRGEDVLRADFVVAACGREARVDEWLAELGYPTPREEIVDAALSYSTRWYRGPRSLSRYNLVVDLPTPPDLPRGGGYMSCEDDKWFVTLMGIAGERTPLDEEGFHAWIRALRFPEVWDFVQKAEPISPIYGSAKTENRHRHFEELSRFPDRFVAVGDAVASFNPMYGQGMSMAVLGAVELGACLTEQRERIGGPSLVGLSRRFQRRLARVLRSVWGMALAEDFRWSATKGERPGAVSRVVGKYMDELMNTVPDDELVFQKFVRVQHLLDPVSSLLAPDVAGRVIERATRPVRAGVREVVGGLVQQVGG
ncbi:FAD-dependent oxidoreductase [Polyangium sp. y55x31]|uniref:FAD-dependent oxidoreductase n=1 Tax=Polyangium sp. y55x31 TaxID=3042688 RepID=UPI002482CE99|nr:FAD-dependent oxidoreductase [Polyangium sp. y55x31]MDI1483869.1 FAD-dependent oxidoreductase [Polyangium sp. y55x31]